MSHTPGPWKAESNGEINSTVEPWGAVATVEANSLGRRRITIAEAEANAALIAAAPDLLAACKAMLAKFDHSPLDKVSVAADMARAAIAKAVPSA